MVELGSELVPAAFKKRFDELTAQNKALKSSVFEAQSEAKAIKEQFEAASKGPNTELEAARAKIAELQTVLSKKEHAAVLSADSMSEEDSEFYDYVQYQYGKITPEEGQEKQSFSEWYNEAKTTNKVIAAAIKEKTASQELPIKTTSKVAAPKIAPKTIPSKNVHDGSENVFDAATIGQMDPTTFKKNQENIRKSMLGS